MTTTTKRSIGTSLGVGRDRIERRGLLDAAQNQEMHAPQQHGGCRDRDGCRPVAKDRKELSQRRLDQDKARNIGQATPGPVAHGRSEAGVLSKSGLGIGIDAGVEIGPAARQRLKDEGQHQHADAGDTPGDQCAEASGGAAERGRQGKNTRADHRTNNKRNERAAREFLVR